MAKDTRERILEAALEIFARDGYAGTNIKDIAEAVGVVKSGFYRHYKSKEDVWNAVMDMVSEYYEEHFGSARKLPKLPDSLEELYEMTIKMVNFTIHDEKVKLARKLLTTEQFHSERVKDAANNYFLYGTQSMFTIIFKEMMEKGIIKETDPETLAFSYTAPITVLVHLCDRSPDKEEEAMDKLKKFVEHFISEERI